MRKHSQELPFLLELQSDHQDIAAIRQQRQLVAKIQSTIAKKDQQIESLKALLEKYQGYQQKYASLKVELAEKTQIIARKDNQSRLLRMQLQDLIKEGEEATSRNKNWETEKQQLMRQRHALERSSKETQRTFKEYQAECRKRQQQLLQDLERAYQANKEQIAKIDELEIQLENCSSLKSRILQLQKQLDQKQVKLKEQTPAYRPTFTESDDLAAEVMRLQEELLRKEEELSRQQMLNYELTIEYDQTISSLCALETEVSHYRRENTDLKQILSLLKQQNQSHEVERRYSKGKSSRVMSRKQYSPVEVEQQNQQSYEVEERMPRQVQAQS